MPAEFADLIAPSLKDLFKLNEYAFYVTGITEYQIGAPQNPDYEAAKELIQEVCGEE
jgi:hypothetical protein